MIGHHYPSSRYKPVVYIADGISIGVFALILQGMDVAIKDRGGSTEFSEVITPPHGPSRCVLPKLSAWFLEAHHNKLK